MRELPFSINDSKSNVFVRRASSEVEKYSFVVSWLPDDFVCGSLRLVDEVRIKYVELNPIRVCGADV